MSVLQKSFFISLPSRRLSATIIVPEAEIRGAMIIAMPLVEERKALMPPVMEAARLFAEKNKLAVLRFDWAGTGDSSGNFADFGPEDWAEDLAAATEWLADRSVRSAECGVRSEKVQGCEGNKPGRACIDDAAVRQSSGLADGIIGHQDSELEHLVEIPSDIGAQGQKGVGDAATVDNSGNDGQCCTMVDNGDNSPKATLFFLGIRSGALLLSSSKLPLIQNAPKIFWDPVGGDEAIHQWTQRHLVNDMVAYGKAQTSRTKMETDLAAGKSIDLDGFEFTSRHQSGLTSLSFTKPTSPTLVICTGKPSASAISTFGESAITQLRLPPYWNSVGYVDTAALREATEQWLAEVRSEECGVRSEKVQGCEGNKPGRACIDDAASPSSGLADGVIGHQDSELEHLVEIPSGVGAQGQKGAGAQGQKGAGAEGRRGAGDAAIVDNSGNDGQCCTMVDNSPKATLVRGVLSLPKERTPRTVLFLSGWSGDRQGPHRMFVQYARKLAEQGVTSLRLDYRGRGEGDGEHNDVGIATMADDAVAAAEWLCANGYAQNGLEVIAICSGCKVAITLATRADIKHLDLLSAEAMGSIRAKNTNTTKSLAALKTYFKKLFKAETWRKIIKGEVRTDMVGKALARHETRSAEEAVVEDATLAKFKKYKGNIHFVYGGSDPDAPAASAAYKRFCKKHGIAAKFDLVPNAGHSYYSTKWCSQVFDILSKK